MYLRTKFTLTLTNHQGLNYVLYMGGKSKEKSKVYEQRGDREKRLRLTTSLSNSTSYTHTYIYIYTDIKSIILHLQPRRAVIIIITMSIIIWRKSWTIQHTKVLLQQLFSHALKGVLQKGKKFYA